MVGKRGKAEVKGGKEQQIKPGELWVLAHKMKRIMKSEHTMKYDGSASWCSIPKTKAKLKHSE